MKAIILAAGRGSRMGELTSNLPKCRTVLYGKELIQWQLDSLKAAGIDDIALVRGYLADTFSIEMTYFENLRWSETNMVMSLVSANDWLKSDTCITSYSDIIFSSDAVDKLAKADGDIVLTYDPNWRGLWELRFDDPLTDAETFRLDGNRVIEIGGRAGSIDDIEGQYMGLVKYTPKGWGYVRNYIGQLAKKEQDALDVTKLLQGLIDAGVDIYATPINDSWYEVDSLNDLEVYESLPTKNIYDFT